LRIAATRSIGMSEATTSPGLVLLRLYYGATVIFLLLDYVLGVNIRLAALDNAPLWRLFYYAFCFACLGLMIWRPALSAWVATAESLLTLSLLIITMALRVIVVSDDMIETGRGAVSLSEIVNFMLVSGVAYVAYLQNLATLKRPAASRTR
jgi:hypothetical protein